MTETDMAGTIEALEKFGLFEDKDYYIEKILQVETYFEARAVNVVGENDYESGNYDAWAVAHIENELHKETRTIGFQLLDKDFKKTTFDALTKDLKPNIPNGKNNCAICGTKVIGKKYNDRRERGGLLRCFDHIGQEVPQ
jgi:hypothetical protein